MSAENRSAATAVVQKKNVASRVDCRVKSATPCSGQEQDLIISACREDSQQDCTVV